MDACQNTEVDGWIQRLRTALLITCNKSTAQKWGSCSDSLARSTQSHEDMWRYVGGVRGGLVNTVLGGGLGVCEVDRCKKERIKGERI